MTHEDAIPSPLTDADARTVFRDRGEIIAALTARNAELEADIEIGQTDLAHYRELIDAIGARADAADATLAKVTALADDEKRHMVRWIDGSHLVDVSDLRAALASAGRPATSDEEDAT